MLFCAFIISYNLDFNSPLQSHNQSINQSSVYNATTKYMNKNKLTLAADYFHSHAGMLVPVHGLKADESSDDWLVKVTVLHWIRIRISFKYLKKELIQSQLAKAFDATQNRATKEI